MLFQACSRRWRQTGFWFSLRDLMSDPVAAVWRRRFNFKINCFFSTLHCHSIASAFKYNLCLLLRSHTEIKIFCE